MKEKNFMSVLLGFEAPMARLFVDDLVFLFCKDMGLHKETAIVMNFFMHIIATHPELTTELEKETDSYYITVNNRRLEERMFGYVSYRVLRKTIIPGMEKVGILSSSGITSQVGVGYYFSTRLFRTWIEDNIGSEKVKRKYHELIPSREYRAKLDHRLIDESRLDYDIDSRIHDGDLGEKEHIESQGGQMDHSGHNDIGRNNIAGPSVHLPMDHPSTLCIYNKEEERELVYGTDGKEVLENVKENENVKNEMHENAMQKNESQKERSKMGDRRDPVNNQEKERSDTTTPKPPPSYLENDNMSSEGIDPVELGIRIEDTIRKHNKISKYRRKLMKDNPELSLDSFKETFIKFLTESYNDYEHYDDGRGLTKLMDAHVKHLKEYKSVSVKTESFANGLAVDYVEFMRNKGSQFKFNSFGGTFVLFPTGDPIPDKKMEEEVDSITKGIQKGKIKKEHLTLLMGVVLNMDSFGDYGNYKYYFRDYDFTKWDDVDKYQRMITYMAKRWIMKKGHIEDRFLTIAKQIANV